jgi:hypothetical protein
MCDIFQGAIVVYLNDARTEHLIFLSSQKSHTLYVKEE